MVVLLFCCDPAILCDRVEGDGGCAAERPEGRRDGVRGPVEERDHTRPRVGERSDGATVEVSRGRADYSSRRLRQCQVCSNNVAVLALQDCCLFQVYHIHQYCSSLLQHRITLLLQQLYRTTTVMHLVIVL